MLQFLVVIPDTGTILQIPDQPVLRPVVTTAWLPDVTLVSLPLRRVQPASKQGVVIASIRSSREKKR